MNINDYFTHIEERVADAYRAAEIARARGIDPVSKVEVPIAKTLAEKSVGLISTIYPQIIGTKIADRIIELEKEHGQLDTAVAFKIAEEIAREKFCKFESLLQAIDAGIRIGFAYITLGVVSSPIEGFTEIKLGKTRKGEDYFIVYFSGPIRSAGTTASCVVLMLIDYLRETFGFAKFDPDEIEVKRYVTENYDYHERVNNLQYLPSEDEISFLAKNLPIQISGEPSESREVSNYKDLDRIETNFIRGGMCLIFSEGLAQKAQKGFRLLKGVKNKGFKTSGWDFLEEYVKKFKEGKKALGTEDNTPVYIKDLVAGRPVYGHPSRSGGFRFRYGRSRTSGFSATAIHPATTAVSDNFLSFGTQLKIEKPTKGCAISLCDEIDGPIVKLKDQSVVKFNDFESAKKIYSQIEEIIYLGDILISFGDVLNRNCDLIKPGYVEEWWELELKKSAEESKESIKIDKFKVSFDLAMELSEKYGIPLHPAYIFYWKEIAKEELFELINWVSRGEIIEHRLIMPYSRNERERFSKGKRALEIIGCEHNVSLENVIINEVCSKALLLNLGINLYGFGGKLDEEFNKIVKKIRELNEDKVLELINHISKFKVKDKSGTFIGARMGRPEKSKLRKLVGSPHVLFPVGSEGGRLRSVQEAVNNGTVKSEFANYYCGRCKEEKIYPKCENCGEFCIKRNYCSDCEMSYIGKCLEHNKGVDYRERRIDMKHYFEDAKAKTGLRNEDIGIVVKGVRGTSNKDHSCEHLGKGLIRAKYGLNVNKDGTIRYDMTEMPITHFKSKEIETSIEKIKALGYEKDIFGEVLENEEQIIEMFPNDIILPSCAESGDERADDVFLRICNFVDDELEKLYKVNKFFNAKSRNDLIGQLVACIAPHICTTTIGRIIGFSKTQTMLASPYMHAAMRRDADGDEAAALLLMDLLINFSRKFLPSHRGGTQDAPLVLNITIRAGDVDDQILDFESSPYGLELYELAEQGKHSSEVKSIETIRKRLKEGKNPYINLGFSHNCSNFNIGVMNSSYKSIPAMQEKVERQMLLCTKIRAVDADDVSRLVIERHFIRDIRGNLRKFSMQAFRCIGCNHSHRRPPLSGKCAKCGGKLIFTISEGGILKYMQPALDLAKRFKVSSYLLESLELAQMYIESIFGRDSEKQEALEKWF